AGVVLLGAALVGALVFGTINTAKFGGPTALPMDKQVASGHPWPERRRALEIYDGSLFSAKLIPSVAYQSLRPDLVAPTGVWPFLRFTGKRPPVPSGLVFDTVEPSAGLTVTSPLLLVLSAVGVVAALRRRRPGRAGHGAGTRPDASGSVVDAAVLRPFLLGGLAATYAPLTIAFVAQRYLTDALPLLVVAGAGGLAVIDGWADRRTEAGSRLPRVAVAVLVVLAVFGVTTTAAVTWSFQRFVIPPDPEARAAGLRTQVAVADLVGDPPAFRREPDRLPARATRAGLVVLGDCRGLYVGQRGGDWSPIEVSGEAGHHRLAAHFDGSPAAEHHALLSIGAEADHVVVTVSGPASAARITLVRNGIAGPPGPPVDLSGTDHVVDVAADPAFPWLRVTVDGREAAFQPTRPPAVVLALAGRDSFGDAMPVDPPPAYLLTRTPTCDALVAASG
ncbi:MAG: hypothetical protein JWM47_588, partial [Acidimicrobiales bacterium]|nr:hypothetical protein [Acidimicrobiales bacterium]